MFLQLLEYLLCWANYLVCQELKGKRKGHNVFNTPLKDTNSTLQSSQPQDFTLLDGWLNEALEMLVLSAEGEKLSWKQADHLL